MQPTELFSHYRPILNRMTRVELEREIEPAQPLDAGGG